MSYTNPSITDFKSRFARDFPYGTDPAIALLDADLTTAITKAGLVIPDAIIPSQVFYTEAFLLLAAHSLVMNIRASSQGIVGQFNFNQASKGVGSVNEAFSIPQRILDNPEFAILTKTNYGAQYLELILPYICGNVFVVCGGTQP
jgi:hypothetical protein